MTTQSPIKPTAQRKFPKRRLASDAIVEAAMIALSCVWSVLIAMEFIYGERTDLSTALSSIWAIFVVDFAIRLLMSPDKISYLRSNWLTGISLVLPTIRMVGLVRLVRIARAARLLKVLSSMSRASRSLGRAFIHRGFSYVALLTTVVTLLGAAAIYGFERASGGIASYGDALWFTAMIMTTMGSGYWPISFEGRILCLLLSLYAFAVFGYFTAALASLLIGKRSGQDDELNKKLDDIMREIKEIKQARQ